MTGRYTTLRHIESLDPTSDYTEIYRLMIAWEFPWDMARALSLAFLRSFAVPRISTLLCEAGMADRTAEFVKRFTLLLEEPARTGFEGVASRQAISAVNRTHRDYLIDNDDFRYSLATFVVFPVQWVNRYGWRPLSEHEVTATVHHYRTLGKLMGIRDLPDSYADFADLCAAYERDHFAHSESNRRLLEAARAVALTGYPKAFAPMGRIIDALMDPPMAAAFGVRAPAVTRTALHTALLARARIVRRMPPRRTASYRVAKPGFL
ncbi:MAG: DUF2236 domain-containing protein [Mycobacteriaceae bacterium]|nr:DUF2236 domain-containing protein [Mycobacteriaceae bacterium]